MNEPLTARIEKYLNDERIGWGITTDLLREALAALKESRRDSYKAAQLDKCDEMLTASGVPQWIENEGMPRSATPERLKWFLNRRKDVSKTEAKQGIDAEIRLGMEHAKEWENK